ncbi:hypothetical protein L1267_01825 [Pseudoalteromonas sp. OFAV1]|uniref:hypothetical protein n=1 Tax=Pseudoalteromonas sp. OFAV1 TaxID=2908892 RepID=UPI001F1E21F1|nr:hypothetical protein [Pseudoalteromonas sp. OFAV1]MCF2899146.1 hypothetical protein [Pseudoalteromonas sp. OFAV1]
MQQANQLFGNFTSGDIIALSSLIIAVLALVTTFWQAYLSRKHNILSVKPHIAINTVTIVGDTPRILILNNGSGTAFINSIDIEFNQKYFSFKSRNSIRELIDAMGVDRNDLCQYLYIADNLSLTPNSSIQLLSFPVSKYDVDFIKNQSVIDTIRMFKIKIEYTCIYNKNYTSSSDLA